MRLTRVHIIQAKTCGGLLDNLDLRLRGSGVGEAGFEPICLVGPNGAGKSQFLQVIAEAFQVVFHACVPEEERSSGSRDLEFVIEYLIRPSSSQAEVLVRISRDSVGRRRGPVKVEKKIGFDWIACPLDEEDTKRLLPSKIVGYTSGGNETLSVPFLVSRSGYADEVGKKALAGHTDEIRDTRLMMIDYHTNLEVLVANLVYGAADQQRALLEGPKLEKIHSFRCIVQLAHGAVSRLPGKGRARKGVQLTPELEETLARLRRCSTCYSEDSHREIYTFDFWVDEQTRKAFGHFWNSALAVYTALHKLSMLNDLAIPKVTRERFKHDISTRRFATRLPEPQDEERVFRFDQVRFHGKEHVVDYVSLSDGEHQLAQILGTLCMISEPSVLFLLDEPESHFNPQWRVKFISRVLGLPTANGKRGDCTAMVSQQDCLLTTHAPFVPSDMSRKDVLIFSKEADRVKVRRPDIETFGTTFDTILAECFDVRPPMSELPREKIAELMESEDKDAVKKGLEQLGDSVERVFVMDRLRQLTRKDVAG
jgi:restriction system-associated AAA family ATPase